MEDMKKVCLLAFVLFTWSIVVNAQESDGRYVEVTGSSEIEVVPDEIHFLVQIKEYWQEEYTGKSKKEEDFHTKVPLAMIEKDLRKSLRKIGITDDAIRTQEIGDYWRQRGKEFLIGKQLDIRLTDFEQINSIIRSVNTWGIESMRIGELKHKDLPMYRKQGKIEALKAAREKAKAVVEQLHSMKLKEAAKKVEDGIEETLTYCDFPSEHWTRIRTNNVIERLNREIRRRTRVVGSFPDGNSALMLVCARLRHVAGTQWGNKKYMNMKHLEAALEDVSVAG